MKIKTWIIFLSWSIFFVHGLVPHIHADPNARTSHVFSFSCHHHDKSEYAKLSCHCEGKGNCSIQGLIFHNAANDENLAGIIEDNHIIFTIPDQRICSAGNWINSPSSLPGNICLRAPPAV